MFFLGPCRKDNMRLGVLFFRGLEYIDFWFFSMPYYDVPRTQVWKQKELEIQNNKLEIWKQLSFDYKKVFTFPRRIDDCVRVTIVINNFHSFFHFIELSFPRPYYHS